MAESGVDFISGHLYQNIKTSTCPAPARLKTVPEYKYINKSELKRGGGEKIAPKALAPKNVAEKMTPIKLHRKNSQTNRLAKPHKLNSCGKISTALAA